VLLLVALLSVGWRGPGWRVVGLRLPSRPARALLIGAAVGVGYQFVGTYLVEPLIARASSGVLPDVSAFRALVGDEGRLAILLTIGWTLGAVVEELVFHGWFMTRVAEIGRYSAAAWTVAALASSVVFGVAHLYQGLSGVIANGLTAVVIAALYFATGRNLWPCIIAHGCLDTTGFVLIYLGVYPGL
jgi:membrane protease YdiL (CAAX protease family)